MFKSVHPISVDMQGYWFRVNGPGVPEGDEKILTIGGIDSPPYGWITEADFEKYAGDPDMYEEAIHRTPFETAAQEGLATESLEN